MANEKDEKIAAPVSAEKPVVAARTTSGTRAAKTSATAPPASDVDPALRTTRRRIAWTAVIGYLGASLFMFMRFFFPRALFEPKTIFRVGYPSDFNLGVDTKFQKQFRIWVVKTADRLFVVYARCTHLGCTPDWKASEAKFKCPCHGSGYDSEGVNFEGPAPRPMDRCKVAIDAEGQIVVDTNTLFDWPKGGENKFERPGSYIRV